MKEYHSGTDLPKHLLVTGPFAFCKTMEDQENVTITVKCTWLDVEETDQVL